MDVRGAEHVDPFIFANALAVGVNEKLSVNKP